MSNSYISIYQNELIACVDNAVIEDLNKMGDHTSKAIFPKDHNSKAQLVAKGDGVLAGVAFCEFVLQRHGQGVNLSPVVADGVTFSKGALLFYLEGDTQTILSLERFIVNAVQRMSGIASLTSQVQEQIGHTSCKVLDTRKTTPNFRIAEKWAVAIGGGVNHRMGLYDAIILKDNHIDFCGGLELALTKIKAYVNAMDKRIPVIVETRDLKEVDVCLQNPWISRIILDNMSPKESAMAVANINGNIPTEASGNIDLQNVADYAETGVDYVSMGAITHAAPVIDLSLRAV
ncbi:MAG: nicotinate-nucleotide diphosphorylase (carboxylating) [Flavobacteriaceae bacterium]|nr:nicotinate-nucleotide diphosphorylase (carboxylating) [Flavobacteriaceae bacterium]